MIRAIFFYNSNRFKFLPEFGRVSKLPDRIWFKWLDLDLEILFV